MTVRIRAAIPRVRYRPPQQSSGITLLDAIADHALFARWFDKDHASWSAWFAFLAALFALPMTKEQLATYRHCTGRNDPPRSIAQEAWLVCGRRAGKSFVLALVAVFLACFFDYREYLAPGERGTVMIIASDRKQARTILRYIRALLKEVPLLAKMIERETAEGFDLSNSLTIEVGTSSFRSVRSYTLVAALLDEVAFWSSEDSSDPDFEVLNALRPGMATIPNAMLLCASSPYARRGVLWDAHRQHFGKDGDPSLVWVAPTRTMNPSVPQSFIDAEVERDPASAASEYFATFRSDIGSFVSREAVSKCVSNGVYERPPERGLKYAGYTDSASGSGKDSWTAAVAFRNGDRSVLACVREIKPPFSPEAAANELAAMFKSYGITTVIGDRYAGDFPRELFRKNGISYTPSKFSASDLYIEFLPKINSGAVDLLDHKKLFNQIISLERRTGRAKDVISHPPGGHDDVANSAAGAIVHLGASKYNYRSNLDWVGGENGELDSWLSNRRARFMTSGGLFR